jgi:hypothetical protein
MIGYWRQSFCASDSSGIVLMAKCHEVKILDFLMFKQVFSEN